MLQDLFTMEINGKMSGGLNTFASNCTMFVTVTLKCSQLILQLFCVAMVTFHNLSFRLTILTLGIIQVYGLFIMVTMSTEVEEIADFYRSIDKFHLKGKMND